MTRPQIYLAVASEKIDGKWEHISCDTINDAIGTIQSLPNGKTYKVLKELDITTELEMAQKRNNSG